MKYTWIQNKSSNSLIVFFNGWGCDEHPFSHLLSHQFDVLMIFDYRNITIEEVLIEEIKLYRKIHVVAWSFGVWVAQYVWEKYQLPKDSSMAINGTTEPVHDQFGIEVAIVSGTLKSLSEKTFMKFQRRMVGKNEMWKKFEANKPKRELQEQKDELVALIEYFKQNVNSKSFYQKVMVGSNDLIFKAANQKVFWKNKAKIIEIESPHFCFYNYSSWDDLFMIK